MQDELELDELNFYKGNMYFLKQQSEPHVPSTDGNKNRRGVAAVASLSPAVQRGGQSL